MMKKKGVSKIGYKGWILILVIVSAIAIIGYQIYYLSIDVDNFYKSEELNNKLDKQLFEQSNLLGKTKIVLKNTPDYISEILGFKKNYKTPVIGEIEKTKDFFSYAIVGFFAGLWIYLINLLISLYYRFPVLSYFELNNAQKEKTSHQGSWLYLVGGDLWKIIIIAMVYGIVMLIPIVNRIIQIITFEVLMPDSVFILSFVLAFYIGFLPAGIEKYARYRMRMKYYKQLMNVKYGVKTAKAMSSG